MIGRRDAPSAIRLLALGAGAAAAVGAAWRLRPGASLDGDVALVTGGSRGLGFLIAERLLEEGCRVAICARDEVALRAAADRLSRLGPVLALRCDVGDADAVRRMVDEVANHFGRLDIVVNNASIIQVGPLAAFTREDFKRAMDVNFWGMVDTTLAALPHLRRGGRGRIANITSIGGKVSIPHLLPYGAAKFAAVGFSEGLRAELAPEGVTVTTVVPGLMRTGSPVHVEFVGEPSKEYVWFTLGDIVPLSAMSAHRAARRIVRAIRRREAQVVLTWQAKLLRLMHDLAPGVVVRIAAGVNRLLPRAPDGAEAGPEPASPGEAIVPRRRGTELRGALPGAAERALDRMGRRANQGQGRGAPPGDGVAGGTGDEPR